jgi:hypothetical protein
VVALGVLEVHWYTDADQVTRFNLYERLQTGALRFVAGCDKDRNGTLLEVAQWLTRATCRLVASPAR